MEREAGLKPLPVVLELSAVGKRVCVTEDRRFIGDGSRGAGRSQRHHGVPAGLSTARGSQHGRMGKASRNPVKKPYRVRVAERLQGIEEDQAVRLSRHSLT